MNIPATLAKCRAELKRQQEMEAKMPALYKHPSCWREGEPGHEEFRADVFRQDKAGEVVGEFYSWDANSYALYFILSRNLNPARLKVAEIAIGGAEKCHTAIILGTAPSQDEADNLKLLMEADARTAAALLGVQG